jgi:diguanylate cyclase
VTQQDTRWRDKYRHSLTQQEQLEKTLAAQQALLHRTVVALCGAAEGQDAEVDKRLSAIRGSLKNNDVGGFERMIKSLDKVTLEADKKRNKQWGGVQKHFLLIANQLQQLSSSSDTKSAVKAYKKRIPTGELLPATIKRLLEEFGHLQNQISTGKNDTKNGLISRLFNKEKNTSTTNEAEATPWEEVEELNTSTADAQQDNANEPSIKEIEGEILHDSSQHETRYRERTVPEAIHQRPAHEPELSQVSDRVTIILTELLDHFPSVECVEQKALKVRQNITRGLSWYELAPTLEDIRDFVIQSSIGADDNYRIYLNNVYQELNLITHGLGLAIQEEEEQRLVADRLHNCVDDGMRTINQALSEHNDIDRLKTAVEAQVHNIQSALKNSLPEKDDNQASLSSQLTSLVERVQRMEKQDADIREQLEQEKIRAVTDKLTGLPNREAYSERVHDEMLRWQRYQHPLSLAVLDIDFFKKVNDQYGHQMGDKVLKAVSSSVANRLREVDFIARFGGEEFVLLLPETSAEDALHMLNRTRERLAKTQMKSKNSDGEETKFTVTFSIGIAQFTEGDTSEEVFERADKALYEAKEKGRNQCIIG